MTCQLTSINDIKKRNPWVNNLLQIRVKILRPAKRKAKFLRNRFSRILNPRKQKTIPIIVPSSDIGSGDIVKVRSVEEIRSMLDDHEKYKGCLFIDEMYEHCDKTYKVLKTVDYFFDEAKQKICKAKNALLLEGVLCSGRQRLYRVSCDRNCFFFWHQDWVKKLD